MGGKKKKNIPEQWMAHNMQAYKRQCYVFKLLFLTSILVILYGVYLAWKGENELPVFSFGLLLLILALFFRVQEFGFSMGQWQEK